MTKLLEIIGNAVQKYGLFPAVALLALLIGGYGCYQAHDNQRTIQQQALDIARLEARLDASTKELSDRMGGVEKSLVELTTQIKLLVDGKLIVGGK